MEIVNQTPFQFGPIAGRVNFPGHSLSLIIKGTFDLAHEGEAAPADEQLPPTGDEPYPDAEDPIRYDADMAHFKPRADLLLVGKCHPSGGAAVPQCRVTFRVGNKTRTLVVTGDRHWESGFLTSSISQAKPFTEMELRYENSFGGEGYKKNPVGKGYRKEETPTGEKVKRLPNIEDPEAMVTSGGHRPEPAGFGPLSRMWEPRVKKLGTYTTKDSYVKHRWPWFPEDFDFAHFNAAPEPMQVQGYLRGDEEVYLENLNAEHAQFRSRLPGLRVRCFVNEIRPKPAPGKDQPPPQEVDPVTLAKSGSFREVEMKLDTLWVDSEAAQAALVWRGVTPVHSQEFEEVAHVFIVSEKLTETAKPIEACRLLFYEAVAEQAAQFEPEEESPEEEADDEAAAELPPVPAPESDAAADKDASEWDKPVDEDAEIEKMQKDVREIARKAGIDPDNPPPLSQEERLWQARYLMAMGTSIPEMIEAGIDTKDIPPDSPEEQQQQAKLKEQMGISDEVEEAIKPTPEREPAEPVVFTRELVEQRIAEDEPFTGEDLSGLDLSGLNMSGVDFSEADFTGTILKGADLSGANLTEAKLAGIDFTGVNLTEANLAQANLNAAKLAGVALQDADLAKCDLGSADLAGAQLDGASFEKAYMANAKIEKASAVGSTFDGTNLSHAALKGAVLDGADFSNANLEEADLQGASLCAATMLGTRAAKANFAEANLAELRAAGGSDFSGCTFRKAAGKESMWEGADLTEADLSYSQMEGADFSKAILAQANLFAANMKFAKFAKADLRGAQLVQMNLFQGSLEKADLSGADLSGSNMYGTEFLDAVIAQTRTEATNLKMTKLVKGR